MLSTRAIKQCDKPPREQMEVVAEFHAYRIQPHRIAYRTGIDVIFVNELISGSHQPKLFQFLLKKAKQDRRAKSLKGSLRQKGASRKSLQDKIEAEFDQGLKQR